MTSSRVDSEHVICAVLRGESSKWTGGADPAEFTRFLDAGRAHGVLPLLAEEFRTRRDLQAWPEAIHAACREVARAQAMHELTHHAEVLGVLQVLADAGIRPLLLKGTGLAYGLYANPALRPRSDSDLLVRTAHEGVTAEVALRGLDYRRAGGPAGRLVGYQLDLRREVRAGFTHYMDLHWRINDHQVFAWLFTFDDLAATSVPVPALGPNVSRLGNVEALVLALIHRAANNRKLGPGAGDKLIWLYDIQLLVGAMSDGELECFRGLVEAKRIGAVALQGLRRCADFFGTPRLTGLIRRLEKSPFAESGSDWLQAGTLRLEWLELRALPSTGARLVYLGGRLFPTADYMRGFYPGAAGWPLPILHARRLLEGFGRRLAGRE